MKPLPLLSVAALLLLPLAITAAGQSAAPRYIALPATGAHEHPPADNVYGDDYLPAPPQLLAPTRPTRVVSHNGFDSIQVNVDALGLNIAGDAANEPTIAIDPLNPDNIVVGWRQFDTIQSNFRQAGYAYSHDGGQTWTFPGSLDPGVFRSDPVLEVDSAGNFYYCGLTVDDQNNYGIHVWKSADAGITWDDGAPAYGGDKQWMAIDRTGLASDGNIYICWQRYANCCGPLTFTRSLDGGATFEYPAEVSRGPSFGTTAVGPEGNVYVYGVQTGTPPYIRFLFSRSENAGDPNEVPSFYTKTLLMGGELQLGAGPNPNGLLGQAQVVVDHSNGPTRGYVYTLCSVTSTASEDPADVIFRRSEDAGSNWKSSVRINNDAVGNGAYQWFGTISVAPNGRLDVVWNDTRNTGEVNLSQLFYAYSTDAGESWKGNIPVSPVFDSYLGWPNQNKLGDYYHMISDDVHANLAYAATFNGEQDVYFVKLGDCDGNGVHDSIDIAGGTADINDNGIPDVCEDCNGNTIPDEMDIAQGTSLDCNSNGMPDECELDDGTSEDCNGNQTPDECDLAGGTATDCNANGMLDECDVLAGTSEDCNDNTTPDECEILPVELDAFFADDPGANRLFGGPIEVSGTRALIGAFGDNTNGPNAGAGYVFRLEGTTWVEEAKLVPVDGASDARCGQGVAITGDVAVLGAPLDDEGAPASGSAYVFRRDGNSWTEEAKLTPSTAVEGQYFGFDVAISGETIFVGTPLSDQVGDGSGAVYVFGREGEDWIQEGTLTRPDGHAYQLFGVSLSASGDTVVVGAHYDNGAAPNAGAAYVYRKVGATWVLEDKLTASDASVLDSLGRGVDIWEDHVIASAPGEDTAGTDAGAGYIFHRTGTTWSEQAKLVPVDLASEDYAGEVVYIGESRALLSSPVHDAGAADAGAVYPYVRHGSTWTPMGTLTPGNSQEDLYFGTGLALVGNTALIGAYGDARGGVNAGAVFLFDLAGGDCNGNGVPDECDVADGTSTDFNGNGLPDDCDGLGDVNCDASFDLADVDPFVLAIVSPDEYAASYPDCDIVRADCNGDGVADIFDIDAFVSLVTGE